MATIREVRRDRVTWRPEETEVVETTGTVRAAQVVNYFLTVVETLLLFRLAMKMFAANPGNAFVNFVYDLTSPLVAPFRGIFASPAESGAVFESSTAVAMIVYAVIAYLVIHFFFTASGKELTQDRSTDL